MRSEKETLAEELGRLVAEYREPDTDGTRDEAWNLIADFAVENSDAIVRALEATGEAKPVGEAGTMPGTAGFTMACFDASAVPVGTKLFAAPVPATSAQVAPDGKTKENGNHVSDSNLGEPLVDSRALDGRRVAVGADTLGDYGGDRLVHRPLAQSEQSSLVAGLPATDTARPLNSGQMKLPATKPYVDRLIRIFNDRPRNDTSAVVLLDYARAALSSAPSTSEGWR